MKTIEQLEAELRAAREAAEAELKAADKAVRRTEEYRITWLSDIRFRAEKRYDEASRAEMAAFKERYGRLPYLGFNREPARWEGMDYMLIDNYLLTDGGGYVILARNEWKQDPLRLSDEACAELRAGRIPDEARYKPTSF